MSVLVRPVPPRVLVVSHTYTAPINRAKLRALACHVALTAVIPRRWRDALFELRSAAADEGYALHALPVAFDGRILRHFYPPLALRRLLAAIRPELVYVEEEPASLVLAELAWLKPQFGYKLICFTWENILRGLGVPGVEGYNLARCDGVVAGNAEAGAVMRCKGFDGPLAVTPQLGVDPDTFRPAPGAYLRQALGLEGFVVGYIGRFVEEKGLRVLYAALRDLPDARLLLLGGGPLQGEIQAWRFAGGSRPCVVDAVPHEQVPGYLNAMDVCVLPSLTTPTWKEQFGHVLIEAMACGVPVVGSDSGAIPEVIGPAGIVVPEGQPEALRAALLDLQGNAECRESLAAAGRDRVLSQYTHAHIAAANAAFFRQVLSR